MLSIGVLGGGAKQYYLELSRGDYYHAGGEPEGHWWGVGAERLELSGTVDKEAFERAFEGFDKSGEALVKNAGYATRRPGWDLTFSAPKSVSVIWSQADPETREAIEKLQERAVKSALGWLEREASFTRTGQGGTEFHQAGIVAALFEHGTSRARDPQLHTHALVFNLGIGEKGQAGSLYSKELYRNSMLLGAIYRAELSHLLSSELGLKIKREKDLFEVEGVPEALCQEFSKRRAAIEEWLKGQSGEETAEKSQWAALATRSTKDHVARADLFPEWQETGKAFGYGSSEVERLILSGKGIEVEKTEYEARLIIERAAQESVESLTRSQAAFSDRALLRGVLTSVNGQGLSFDRIHQGVSEYLGSSKEVVHLGEKNGLDHYTTREILELEHRLLESVRGRVGESQHQIKASEVTTLVSWSRSKGEPFSEEQEKALRHITEEAGGVKVVSGMAGAGKTTLLRTARQTWELSGYEVLGTSLAGKAARGLEDGAGIKSQTIARLLGSLDRGQEQLSPQTVLVVDEAAMVDTRQMGRLVDEAARAGAKLVLVGDAEQLQPIEIGGAFRGIKEITGEAQLTEIRRQRADWMKEVVRDMAEGRSVEALSALSDRGRLTFGESHSKARESLLRDWSGGGVEHPEDNLILTGTKKEVTLLNREAQAIRRQKGKLGESAYTLADGNMIYEGDRVKFTKNSKPLSLFNGDFGTVARIDSQEQLVRVELDRGEEVTVPLGEYPHLMLGYASTTHSAQGMTVENAYILTGDSMTDKHMGYVQLSRARESTFVYSGPIEDDTMKELARLMEKSRVKEMAASLFHRGVGL